jgi:hypothetical protein
MLNRLEEDNLFLDKFVFSDEATFHLSGKVNHRNLIIWELQNPHQVVEHVRDSPKVTVFCAVSRTQVYGPFFFAETTVTSHVYLDRLEHFLVPQLDVNNVIWQQDGAWPHYHRDVKRYLNQTFPGRWKGRGGYIPWPPRSPYLTPMDFSFWGFVKDNVYIPPMPVDLQELRDRIVNAIALVHVTFLGKLWVELEYRLDVSRIIRGSNIEHL